MKLLHISVGRREWEVQARGDGDLFTQSSGAPYLTRREALAAARIWKTYDFYDSVVVRNVRTGEALRP